MIKIGDQLKVTTIYDDEDAVVKAEDGAISALYSLETWVLSLCCWGGTPRGGSQDRPGSV